MKNRSQYASTMPDEENNTLEILEEGEEEAPPLKRQRVHATRNKNTNTHARSSTYLSRPPSFNDNLFEYLNDHLKRKNALSYIYECIDALSNEQNELQEMDLHTLVIHLIESNILIETSEKIHSNYQDKTKIITQFLDKERPNLLVGRRLKGDSDYLSRIILSTFYYFFNNHHLYIPTNNEMKNLFEDNSHLLEDKKLKTRKEEIFFKEDDDIYSETITTTPWTDLNNEKKQLLKYYTAALYFLKGSLCPGNRNYPYKSLIICSLGPAFEFAYTRENNKYTFGSCRSNATRMREFLYEIIFKRPHVHRIRESKNATRKRSVQNNSINEEIPEEKVQHSKASHKNPDKENNTLPDLPRQPQLEESEEECKGNNDTDTIQIRDISDKFLDTLYDEHHVRITLKKNANTNDAKKIYNAICKLDAEHDEAILGTSLENQENPESLPLSDIFRSLSKRGLFEYSTYKIIRKSTSPNGNIKGFNLPQLAIVLATLARFFPDKTLTIPTDAEMTNIFYELEPAQRWSDFKNNQEENIRLKYYTAALRLFKQDHTLIKIPCTTLIGRLANIIEGVCCILRVSTFQRTALGLKIYKSGGGATSATDIRRRLVAMIFNKPIESRNRNINIENLPGMTEQSMPTNRQERRLVTPKNTNQKRRREAAEETLQTQSMAITEVNITERILACENIHEIKETMNAFIEANDSLVTQEDLQRRLKKRPFHRPPLSFLHSNNNQMQSIDEKSDDFTPYITSPNEHDLPEYSDYNASNTNQFHRQAVIQQTQFVTHNQDETSPFLNMLWQNLFDAIQIGSKLTFEFYNDIPANDPLKTALERTHTPKLIHQLMAFCVLSTILDQPIENANHDNDVTINTASFRILLEEVCKSVHDNTIGIHIGLPSHHAKTNEFMGYCLLSTAHIASELQNTITLHSHTCIVGLDIHADNGRYDILKTQAENGLLEESVTHIDLHGDSNHVYPNEMELNQTQWHELYCYYPVILSDEPEQAICIYPSDDDVDSLHLIREFESTLSETLHPSMRAVILNLFSDYSRWHHFDSKKDGHYNLQILLGFDSHEIESAIWFSNIDEQNIPNGFSSDDFGHFYDAIKTITHHAKNNDHDINVRFFLEGGYHLETLGEEIERLCQFDFTNTPCINTTNQETLRWECKRDNQHPLKLNFFKQRANTEITSSSSSQAQNDFHPLCTPFKS